MQTTHDYDTPSTKGTPIRSEADIPAGPHGDALRTLLAALPSDTVCPMERGVVELMDDGSIRLTAHTGRTR